MTGVALAGELTLDPATLGRLLPLHLRIDARGEILSHGPLLARIAGAALVGARLWQAFDIRQPARPRDVAELLSRAGGRVRLSPATGHGADLRGLALALPDGGALLATGLGIGIVDAVRRHALTQDDLGPGSLAPELLYLVEANAAVRAELHRLTARLHGAQKAAKAEALTDTLTGLENRRAFGIALDRALERGAGFALLHMDLDHFKPVNDRFGHAAGDQVLASVARVLRGVTRAGDHVARIGGDEFVLLLAGPLRPDRLEGVFSRILRGVARPIRHDGNLCRVTASLGAVWVPAGARPVEGDLMRMADEALYAAKRDGRGRAVLVHHPP